jgi:hypothetical protein
VVIVYIIKGITMNEVSEKGTQLGETHWGYIEQLLRVHGEDEKVIQKIRFHYVQAMKHGYKHGVNDSKQG